MRPMKTDFRNIRSNKGMTYVELLVALSILAIIVVVFTPMLMLSYTRLYDAGEINVNTYEVKSELEESLAVRSSSYKVNTNFKFKDLSESLDLLMQRVVGTINGLETMYGSSKTNVAFLSDEVVFDNKSTHEMVFQFTNFSGLTTSSFVKTSTPAKNQVGFMIEAPLSDVAVTPSQYSATYDSVTGNATITVTGVDVTYSPLKIAVYSVGMDGATSTNFNYLTIKPANMIFVGGADASIGYYTSEGYSEEAGGFSVEGRVMSAGSLASGTQFNKIRYISGGVDAIASKGYYVMCGNNGVIRRLWNITENEFTSIPDYGLIGYGKVDGNNNEKIFKSKWNGDYTEIYTYRYEDKNTKGKNVTTGSRVISYSQKASTLTKYSGSEAGWGAGSRQNNCIQISNHIAGSADYSGIIKNGIYFYTGSDSNSYAGVKNTLRKDWMVNWEDADSYAWANNYDGNPNTYNKEGRNPWANYLSDTYANPNPSGTNQQPVVFFGSVGGARDSSTGGKANISATNQIDRIYLMTNNNPGSRIHKTKYSWFTNYFTWYKYDSNLIETKSCVDQKRDHSHDVCDVAARFTESPGASYAFNAGLSQADRQQRVIQFVLDRMGSAVMTCPPYTSVFTGVASPASDREIPYIRLKFYTNSNAQNSSSYLSTLTAEEYSSEERAAVDSATQNNAMNSVALTLTDLCYISHPANLAASSMSGSHTTYTGYAPASASVYTTCSSSSTVHGTVTSGNFRQYIVRGTGEGYDISQLPDTTSHTTNLSSLPAGSVTRTDSNSAFTIGYFSNRLLMYSGTPSTTFPGVSTIDKTLKFPEDFKTHLGFAQDGDATIAVGYVVTGNAEATFTTVANCKDASHAYGSKPLDMHDPTFFYNGNIFGELNEDLATLDDSGNMTYKKGYYLEAANPNNAATATAYVYQYTTCAMGYTGFVLKAAGAEQPIINVATVSLHIKGDNSFRTLYTAPLTTDSRFTCAALVSTGSDTYVAYIGDSKGNIWEMSFTSSSVSAVPTIVSDSSFTALSKVNSIYVTDEYIIAVGETSTAGSVTRAVIYEASSKHIQSKPIVSSAKYILNDIIQYNGRFYAAGSYTSGAVDYGVILYASDPLGNWTIVLKDVAGNNFKPLKSVASDA